LGDLISVTGTKQDVNIKSHPSWDNPPNITIHLSRHRMAASMAAGYLRPGDGERYAPT
jgi:hypothetical protein